MTNETETQKMAKASLEAAEILKKNIVLNTKQILQILGISRTTFASLRKEKDFPKPLGNGNRHIWSSRDIAKWTKTV